MKIKKIYRDIVKKLHPDISDLMDKDDRLKELWVRANEAYSANDLDALEEAYAQIQLILAGMGENGEINVSDIEDKIIALIWKRRLPITALFEKKFGNSTRKSSCCCFLKYAE